MNLAHRMLKSGQAGGIFVEARKYISITNEIKETTRKNIILDIIDNHKFDEYLEKVTNSLFKIIIIAGLPFFCYVMIQFILSS